MPMSISVQVEPLAVDPGLIVSASTEQAEQFGVDTQVQICTAAKGMSGKVEEHSEAAIQCESSYMRLQSRTRVRYARPTQCVQQ